ncbi:Transducin/WD40 repeat-like superfamily protein [Striga hermonthica]|uniref:Transducin/WD40 repeat-like superfamily protein n=1 Tax=Striga hermonthica TaxID=68872 RepID=A0A9N7NSA1_STRHE|nr:Transducin/WD40 repeat-like superfamily protein [Striga hermonthica]
MGEEAGEESRCPPESATGADVEISDGSNSWPVVRYDVPPYRTYHFYRQFRTTASNPNNFLKGVKWSPDGSCFLSCSDDNKLRVFSLPYDETGSLANVPVSDSDSYEANLVIGEGEAVYDYCWYPYMSASSPDSCVFATSTRDHPIHLWDANSGQLRCTYRAYDAVDEITAAFSIGFNPDGTKIFAGYNKTIRIFDVHRPGRDFGQHSTLSESKEGQSGIISSIAFSPTNSGMLAAGSYSQTTAIYREDNMELLYVLHGQGGGVTQVQFSKDGNYLYTGGRKDPYILCWDIRKTVDIVYKLYRSSESTNQRIQFDIEPFGRYLGTGGQDGLVHIYDLQTGEWVSSFQAASDTINGVSFHPLLPMAATSSGQRRYGGLDDDSEENKNSLTGDENCLSVWSFYSDTGEDVVFGNAGD